MGFRLCRKLDWQIAKSDGNLFYLHIFSVCCSKDCRDASFKVGNYSRYFAPGKTDIGDAYKEFQFIDTLSFDDALKYGTTRLQKRVENNGASPDMSAHIYGTYFTTGKATRGVKDPLAVLAIYYGNILCLFLYL